MVNEICCEDEIQVPDIICERIRRLRKRSGYRQRTLARLLGISQSAVSKIEKDPQGISAEVLFRLAELYGVTLDYLVGRTEIEDYGKIAMYSTIILNALELIPRN